MTQQPLNRKARRGRIFPELIMSPEEIAKEEADKKAFSDRCRPIFERLRPQLIEDYYNWFLVIEPDSEDYFIDRDSMAAVQKALAKHPQRIFFTYRINETGVCGRL
ncbi:MAG: hypothetical protein EBE86_006930 [Hormoscilla sp. GUM202]|nr:hypothetical protein [Hormoscilla sp. GUM202]